jgi:hypothetical protein
MKFTLSWLKQHLAASPSIGEIALTALSFVIALGAGEALLRLYDPANIRSGWRNPWEMNFVRGNYTEANQLGFRGKQINISDGDFVVVLIGDSQVECFSCADNHLPEDALQTELAKATGRDNIKVFSLGALGYGADQELLALKAYYAKGYRANLVVVWQTLGNDIWNALFPAHSTRIGVGHLKPTFRLDEFGKLLWPDHQMGDYFCSFYIECIYRIRRYGSMDGYWDQFLPPPSKPTDKPAYADIPVVETSESVDAEKSHWAVFLPKSPRMEYGVVLTRALYEEIRAETAREGTRFVIFDVNRWTDAGLADLEKIPFFKTMPQYIKLNNQYFYSGGKESYLATSRSLNAGFDFIMIDIDIRNHTVAETDPHLNERGNSRVMQLLARELKARQMVSPLGGD